jgi:hypothetical protein
MGRHPFIDEDEVVEFWQWVGRQQVIYERMTLREAASTRR